MPELINLSYFKEFFVRGHERTKRAKNNIVVSFLSKAVSIVISFLIVPLTLSYVGKTEYGIWMTISSVIHWFAFFDIGLGNGLRNKLAETLALKDIKTAKTYISSSFAFITAIAGLLFITFFFAASSISWNKVLNTELIKNEELTRIVIMVFSFFCVGFVFNLVSTVLQALQRYAVNDILSIITQLIGLIGIYLLTKTTDGSLYNLALIYGGKGPVVMLIAGILLFGGSLKYLRPSVRYINFKKAFPLINLGLRFFINQILYLVVAQSSLIIVAQMFGPGDVTVYNLAVRYMTITSMGYMMVLTPFLSAFTEAYTKGEFTWIRNIITKLKLIWLLASLFSIMLIIGYRPFFSFWVGEDISVPLPLIIAMAISGVINMWSSTYSLFLNGIGKIQVQLYLLFFQALLFIPLSLLFYKLNFGLVSPVASQIVLYSINAFFMTKQYKKVISNQAKGVWLK